MLKKTAFSVLATATLATLIATGDAEASSATYKVNSGDTLWRISLNHNVSVTDLKKWNNLSSDIIYPNQTLKVTGNKETSSNNSSSSSSTSSSNSSSNSTSKPSTSQTSTSAYTVKSGDTLGSIASRHQTTVAKLASLNGIRNTNYIYVGQKIKVDGKATSNTNTSANKPSTSKPNTSKPSTSKPSNSASSGSSSTTGTYVVKSGDTLSQIAYSQSMTVNKLMKNNNLTSHMIYVGQKLSVNGKATSNSSASTNNNTSANKPSTSKPTTGASNSKPSTSSASTAGTGVYSSLINAGKKYQGVPYVWGGSSPSGFDCSGFIYYVHNEVGINIPRTNTDGYYNRSFSVSNPIPGDLVFFKNTYKQGISHMGIYLGNGQFLHAGTSQGVTIGNVNDSYWGPKFAGYKRLYEVAD